MMKLSKSARPVTAVFLLATGCNTIATQKQFWSGDFENDRLPLGMVYSGTAMDFAFLRGSSWIDPGPDVPWTVPFLVDVPLSFVLDTGLLPLTIGQSVALNFRGDPEKELGRAAPTATALARADGNPAAP